MKNILFLMGALCFSLMVHGQRKSITLEKGWCFMKGEQMNAFSPLFDDSKWEKVKVPHDWAITGPFDRNNDLQDVAIIQDMEKKASLKTGRTGGLPYMGIGWYRTTFQTLPHKRAELVFDGAMSEARIYVNGREVGEWPYGYSSFHFDITPYIHQDGNTNLLAVRLDNKLHSSRWYPGAGLYRNVHLIMTDSIHVPVWGTYITTPHVSSDFASVCLKTNIDNAESRDVRVVTDILEADGRVVSSKDNTRLINKIQPFEQHFIVDKPNLWSPESPYLYTAKSKIYVDGKLVDQYNTRFGIRSVEFVADRGFFLNGLHRKFQGVCNHHDLGPLGAAVNREALRHQLVLLKDMGCDAIRTSHNMPAPELVELCDEMGFMMIIEPFDEWDMAKCENGYHRFFETWAEKDMINMLHQYRNHASVIMWSIGNEVPTQCNVDGYRVAKYLQDICHREDPTRLVTCGMDQVSCVLDNGFAAMLDIPGLNYRTQRYSEAYQKLPQNIVLGSETASTVSSRGTYKFPVKVQGQVLYSDHQSSGYDTEYCSWSNIPDVDFSLVEDYPWTLGQFVWTGFDYLGEPSPYSVDSWPSHSSLFGIIDLASIPKDRYYLYRSIWNKKSHTLHLLPNWTWPGREGKITPVFVYTDYPEVELFVNGKSYGRQRKWTSEQAQTSTDSLSLLRRYRLMWMNVVYEPGELKAVAYDIHGCKVSEETIYTAGKPHHLELISNRSNLQADGKDLAYITVRLVDINNNLCTGDDQMISMKVKGVGAYKAGANGDATCLDLFNRPLMRTFKGQLTAIVQSLEKNGTIIFEASAKGLKTSKLFIQVY